MRTFATLTQKGEIRGKEYGHAAFRARAEALQQQLSGRSRRQMVRCGEELRFLACPMPDGGTCLSS